LKDLKEEEIKQIFEYKDPYVDSQVIEIFKPLKYAFKDLNNMKQMWHIGSFSKKYPMNLLITIISKAFQIYTYDGECLTYKDYCEKYNVSPADNELKDEDNLYLKNVEYILIDLLEEQNTEKIAPFKYYVNPYKSLKKVYGTNYEELKSVYFIHFFECNEDENKELNKKVFNTCWLVDYERRIMFPHLSEFEGSEYCQCNINTQVSELMIEKLFSNSITEINIMQVIDKIQKMPNCFVYMCDLETNKVQINRISTQKEVALNVEDIAYVYKEQISKGEKYTKLVKMEKEKRFITSECIFALESLKLPPMKLSYDNITELTFYVQG